MAVWGYGLRVRGSENLENFKLRAVDAAAGQTFVCVGGRSRQAEAAGVDESLFASWWCAVDFFAHVLGFFTDDAVGCQKTYTLFSLLQLGADGPVLQVPDGLRGCAHQRRAVDGGLGAVVVLGRHRRRAE